jgi:RimJ/RimL family protein N-acetyltransferase
VSDQTSTAASVAARRRLGCAADIPPDLDRPRSSTGATSADVDVFVETERLVLRPFALDDLELLVELDSDPEVKRYIDGGAAVDRQELADMLSWWLGYYERYVGYGFWAALEKRSGVFLGWFHLRPGEGAGPLEPELGYRLRREVWGRGFATEGSRALIDKAVAELGADRVNASTMAVNIGSRRVMEKAGLRFVRTFHGDWPVRIPGDEHGAVEYAIDRAQWENDRAAS